ncbi:MAG: hypothetical protein V4507_06490 [Verrucomicrobiota bacterium]
MMKTVLYDQTSPLKISNRAMDHRSKKNQQHRYERRKCRQYYRMHWTQEVDDE